MKAFVFAAGLGTRLRPLTLTRPKALVEVGGVPMLKRVIDNIISAGISDVIVNVHHFAGMIKDYISAEYGDTIKISDESDRLLDTGGALVKAADIIGNESLLIHNADILTDQPLTNLIRHHNQSEADATLLVDSTRESSRRLVFEDGLMKGWINLTTGETIPAALKTDSNSMMAFGGIHIINPKVMTMLREYSSDEPFSITPFYAYNCSRLKIGGYDIDGSYRWFDIGKPSQLQIANESVKWPIN